MTTTSFTVPTNFMNKNTKRKAVLARRKLRAEGGGANLNTSVLRSEGKTRSGAPRKPWKGGGDPLKRGKVDYRFRTESPYEKRSGFMTIVKAVGESGVTMPRRKPLAQLEVVDLIGSRK